MYIILALSILVVIATISTGVYMVNIDNEKFKKNIKQILGVNLALYIPLLASSAVILVPNVALAASEGTLVSSTAGLGYLAAALSTGCATIGTGIAVAGVGSSALGAVSEDPKILGKTMIFVGMAEGIAIYGLIVSIMILGRI